MKVLLQYWILHGGGYVASLSKDQDAFARFSERMANSDDGGEPDDGPDEITIPDKSPFAVMVEQRGSIVLHDDEMDVVWNAPEFKD